jgi:hypothetical protein
MIPLQRHKKAKSRRSRAAKMKKRPKPLLDCIVQTALFHAVTLTELLDAASGIDDLLLAGVERMAGRTDFNVKLVLAQRGTGYECAAAGAGHSHFLVIGVNAGFHGNSFGSNSENEGS